MNPKEKGWKLAVRNDDFYSIEDINRYESYYRNGWDVCHEHMVKFIYWLHINAYKYALAGYWIYNKTQEILKTEELYKKYLKETEDK